MNSVQFHYPLVIAPFGCIVTVSNTAVKKKFLGTSVHGHGDSSFTLVKGENLGFKRSKNAETSVFCVFEANIKEKRPNILLYYQNHFFVK